MTTAEFVLSILREPPAAMPYAASARIAAIRSGKHVLETSQSFFDPAQHASAGLAQLTVLTDVHEQRDTSWHGPTEAIVHALRVAWLSVQWKGQPLEVVKLTFLSRFGEIVRHAVIAENEATATAYFGEVCRYCSEVRDEILVFANGCWAKNKELYASIRATSFADVVLADGLAERLRDDFDRFASARGQYEQWSIPWKRGALFLGPPGNGKTMTIKALIRHLGMTCLYVQSFVSPQVMPEQVAISEVFKGARRMAPCVMVLEDLDSLITPSARSFFLNELDGFASNTGLITIGSTNHPERLDPAIVDCPSRFDRKYHFELPGEGERRRYVAAWNARLASDLRLDDADVSDIATATPAFSFAYLKELFAASLMRFASQGSPSLMAVLREEADALRAQMLTTQILPNVSPGEGSIPDGVAAMLWHRAQGRY